MRPGLRPEVHRVAGATPGIHRSAPRRKEPITWYWRLRDPGCRETCAAARPEGIAPGAGDPHDLIPGTRLTTERLYKLFRDDPELDRGSPFITDKKLA